MEPINKKDGIDTGGDATSEPAFGMQSEGTHGAKLLVSALEAEAFKRRHTHAELAIAIGVHPAHWYRLRANPHLLVRCERETLESIAVYLGWPFWRVLLGSGVVGQSEVEVLLGGDELIASGIEEIESGPLGAGLVHPLKEAPRDHQLLFAELYFSLRAEIAKTRRLLDIQGTA